MSVTVKNLTSGTLAVGGLTIGAGETVTTDFMSASVSDAVDAGYVSVSPTKASRTMNKLTDSSGGTASTTLVAISATYVQAEVRDSIASLAAQLNVAKLAIDDLNAQIRFLEQRADARV